MADQSIERSYHKKDAKRREIDIEKHWNEMCWYKMWRKKRRKRKQKNDRNEQQHTDLMATINGLVYKSKEKFAIKDGNWIQI